MCSTLRNGDSPHFASLKDEIVTLAAQAEAVDLEAARAAFGRLREA